MRKLIRVKVSPGSSRNKVEKKKEDFFSVLVREKAEGGEANKAMLKLLSKEMNIPEKSLHIIKGSRSSSKIIEILG